MRLATTPDGQGEHRCREWRACQPAQPSVLVARRVGKRTSSGGGVADAGGVPEKRTCGVVLARGVADKRAIPGSEVFPCPWCCSQAHQVRRQC